jgi:hypothetical protein
VRKVDGEWQVAEKPGGPTGLPRKLRSVKMHIRTKPEGSPGRTPPEGYSLQGSLRMSDADYRLVYVSYLVFLYRFACTHGLYVNSQMPRPSSSVRLGLIRLWGLHARLAGLSTSQCVK